MMTNSNDTPDKESNHENFGMAFDPKSQSRLILSSTLSWNDKDDENNNNVSFRSFLADDGTGCNTEETCALMRIIDERDQFLSKWKEKKELGVYDESVARAIRDLNVEYRRALVDCIRAWENRLSVKTMDEENKNNETTSITYKKDMEREMVNLDLLKMTHTICHLSEIYLFEGTSLTVNSNPYGTMMSDEEAGCVTANTIRYLRLNHMVDPFDYIADDLVDFESEEGDKGENYNASGVEGLLMLNQPEHYRPQHATTNHLPPYWALVRKLVLRGCLKDAWAVLSRHSACRRVVEFSNNSNTSSQSRAVINDPTVRQDAEAFSIIRGLLLSAPLPGGRSDANDAGLGPIDDNDADMDNEDNEEGREMESIAGIPTTAYKLWDPPLSSTPSSTQTYSRGEYDLYSAHNFYISWRQAIEHHLKSNSALRNLNNHIPYLQSCLWNILLGKSSSFVTNQYSNSDDDYLSLDLGLDDGWAEILAAELLYVRPKIKKQDIHVRAWAAMKKSKKNLIPDEDENDNLGQLEEIVLNIMSENAGSIVEVMHGLGGGSGAALPATMTVLLCNLLTNANYIDLSSLSFNIQTELLLSAANSIQSSFASQNHHDVGVRLAIRLLLPHAIPSASNYSRDNKVYGDINDESSLIASHIGEILGRHHPRSETEARNLMSLCWDVLRAGKRGSRQILDAHESLTLCQFRHQMNMSRPGNAVFWLLWGMECACKWGGSVSAVDDEGNGKEVKNLNVACSSGPCMRIFTQICNNAAISILNELVEYWKSLESGNGEQSEGSDVVEGGINNIIEDKFAFVMKVGKDIVETISREESMSYCVNDMPCVLLLQKVHNIGLNTISSKNSNIAKDITFCLRERPDVHGAVATCAHPSLYFLFISLAVCLLRIERDSYCSDMETNQNSNNLKSNTSFDVNDIHILMLRFHEFMTANDDICCRKAVKSFTGEDANRIRFELSKGLMRAFFVENMNIGEDMTKSISISSQDEQKFTSGLEREVELMLGPSL